MNEDYFFDSMVKGIFTEYCDIVLIFVDETKVKVIQELGRTKAHMQKKRAKEFYKTLETIGEKETAILGCYDELKYNLLRQLYRMIGESPDYQKAEKFLTEKVDEEKKEFKKILKKG